MTRSLPRLRLTAVATFGALSLSLAVGAVPASAAAQPNRPAPTPLTQAGHQPQGKHVTVKLLENGGVKAPATLRAGRYTFQVAKGSMGAVQLARPVKGYTRSEFVRDATASSRKAYDRSTRLGRQAGGTVVDGRGGSFTTTLYPGRYWMFNYQAPPRASRISVIEVTGAMPRTSFPRISGTAVIGTKAVRAPRVLPRSGEILISNRNGGLGALMLFPADYDPSLGVTPAQLHKAAMDNDSFDMAVSGAVASGTSFVWKYTLPAGRYLVIDMYNDDVHPLDATVVTLR